MKNCYNIAHACREFSITMKKNQPFDFTLSQLLSRDINILGLERVQEMLNYTYKERGKRQHFPFSRITFRQECGMNYKIPLTLLLTIQGQRYHLSFHVRIDDDLLVSGQIYTIFSCQECSSGSTPPHFSSCTDGKFQKCTRNVLHEGLVNSSIINRCNLTKPARKRQG